MNLRLHPDPQHPAGGYGFCELPGDTLPETVMLAVQDAYSQRWLHPGIGPDGQANWQAARYEFGSYPVYRHDGADWVRFGPEIVDRIGEYMPLRLEIDGSGYDVTWPDTLVARAEPATGGALSLLPSEPPRPDAPDERAPPPRPEPAEPAEPARVRRVDSRPRRGAVLWLVVLLLLLGAGAAAWYLLSEPAPVAQNGGPKAEPVAAQTSCGLRRLQGLGTFPAQLSAIRDCGGAVSPDTALRLIEDAAEAGDADALLLFGTLYDGEELAPRIENLIGLSFADDPARAVEYYSRASAAGSTAAEGRVTATCARLAGSALTLERGAYDDFCR